MKIQKICLAIITIAALVYLLKPFYQDIIIYQDAVERAENSSAYSSLSVSNELQSIKDEYRNSHK